MARASRKAGLLLVECCVATLAVICVMLLAPARSDTVPPFGQPETPTARPLPTWQTNGTVWSIAVVNGTTYVGGNFTTVRPPGSAPGQNEVERRHIAAFDATTGALLPWRPRLTSPPQTFSGTPDVNCNPLGDARYECASVWSVEASPDGMQLYVGGAFQLVDGQSRPFVAAFDLPSGTLDPTFKPRMNGRVYAIAATNATAFLGGTFTKANGLPRTRLAAVTVANQTLPWNPAANKRVRALELTADRARLVVGGNFDRLDGGPRQALGAVSTAGEGVLTPWAGGQMAATTHVTSLNRVGKTVYVTGEDGSGSRSEGVQAVDPSTGATVWTDSCRGASHSSAALRGIVFVGSHSHDCSRMVDGFPEQYKGFPLGDRARYRLRAEIRQGQSVRLLHWFPYLDDPNGPRAMATDGSILWVGGEFRVVDTTAQQGLTRFTFDDNGGTNAAPMRPPGIRASSVDTGQVHVTWRTAEDRDNRTLTYEVIRDGNRASPIFIEKQDGRPWSQPWLSHIDTDVTPGSTHTYSVRAVDPAGRSSPWTDPVTVTVPTTPVPPTLVSRRAGPVVNYRFEEATGAKEIASTVGGRRAVMGSKASLVAAGRLGRGLALTGSAGSAAVDTTPGYAKRQASVEALFRTTSTRGGALLSVGTSGNPMYASSNSRNILYMSNDGRLNWGFLKDTWPVGTAEPVTTHQAITTSARYNDGQWHHVVATFEPGTGARIYADGALVAWSTSLNSSRALNGYFRIGGDATLGYPNRPWSGWWAGTLDEVAAYDYPLSQAQVAAHAAAFLGD